MSLKLKRGPPYDDDPGCKYIVIEDPWPGDATGKDRYRNDSRYFNFLCAWVRFMLNKEHDVECVFAVNTRNEVVVQLPQDVDIAPILGAHPWRKFLDRGHRRDTERVSYVFAYDYRNKGDPAKHNWQEIYPIPGDPPPRVNFPVKFPYPHVSWASLRNKNCADIALPLPLVRQPTPIPDTSGFTPYQHPSQLTSNTVNNAVDSHEEERQAEQWQRSHGPPTTDKLSQRDPFEEEAHALQSLRHSSTTDVKPRIKTESQNAAVKQEQEPYAPSRTFRTAIEELQQARSMNAQDPSQLPIDQSTLNGDIHPKREDIPSGPSESFIAAFNDIRRGNPSESANEGRSEAPRAKPDPDLPPAPSDSFAAAFSSIRGTHNGRPSPHRQMSTDNVAVKREATRPASIPTDDRHAGTILEPGVGQPARQDAAPTSDPRRIRQDAPGSKRVKEEDRIDGPTKRFKKES
ncbi:hypothetical protein L226DRAFT_608005 [Lentinus tigrinus ALCF2SS1-7]|uniref:uncharacterized protein n=1 Tax=Lentinus tigrinus ALCF2SS1-7 TaxID=1328758 RepID=UPI00116602B6|nr:hypothetical protein L226DRAFT_608005 [Lentinus tigrinus ALCF2SS1-7]